MHGFDIEVYDDAIGGFVDLGHTRTAPTRDLFDINGDGSYQDVIQVAGDYHADRLVPLTPMGDPALDVRGDAKPDSDYDGSGGRDPHPFGNRFDTWHPDMTLMSVGYRDDGGGTFEPVSLERPYPPPYRPVRNPFGGEVGFPTRDKDGKFLTPDLTFTGTGLVTAEDLDGGANLSQTPVTTPALLDDSSGFLDEDLPLHAPPGGGSTGGYYAKGNVDGQPLARLFPNPNVYGEPGTGDEKPLRAVRITVRYYDVQSDQMREESFRHSLTD